MEEITSRVAISSTSEATRQIIERKSAANLPDQPSASGMKPAEIKRAFYAPVLDSTGSVLSEVERVISEANECFATLHGIEERHKERLESLEKFEKTADENLTALNEAAEDHGRRIRGLEHAGTSLKIVDDLETADPELPLSARQGKLLNERKAFTVAEIDSADWVEDNVPAEWYDVELTKAQFPYRSGNGIEYEKTKGCGYAYDFGKAYNRIYVERSGDGWGGHGGGQYAKYALALNPFPIPDPDYKDWEITRDESGKITKMVPRSFLNGVPMRDTNYGHLRVSRNVSDYEDSSIPETTRQMYATSKNYVDTKDNLVKTYTDNQIALKAYGNPKATYYTTNIRYYRSGASSNTHLGLFHHINDENITQEYIPLATSDGRIECGTPKGDVECTNKGYVDSKIHSGTDAEGTSRWIGALNDVSAKHAFGAGYNNKVSGPSAAAFGDANIISGWAGFAAGYGNNDNGKQYVFLGGRGNSAAMSSQALVGSYNEIDSGMVFGVGGGTSTSARKTLFRVRSDGRATLGAAPTEDNDCANKGYVDNSIANLVNGAPAQLDALNELAAALGNDANFAATVTSRIAKLEGKIPDVANTGHWAYTVNRNSSGTNTPVHILISHAINGSYSSQIPLRSNGIIKTATPVADDDCANKKFVNDAFANGIGTVAIAHGGTGATTAEAARANLGIKDAATYDVSLNPIADGYNTLVTAQGVYNALRALEKSETCITLLGSGIDNGANFTWQKGKTYNITVFVVDSLRVQTCTIYIPEGMSTADLNAVSIVSTPMKSYVGSTAAECYLAAHVGDSKLYFGVVGNTSTSIINCYVKQMN